MRHIFLEFEKIFRISIFLSISEGFLINIPSLLEIFHFPLLQFRDRMFRMFQFRSSCLQLFFKIGYPKIFAIFTGKHLCWSLFLMKQPTFRAAPVLKEDSSTGVFLRILQKLFKTAFDIEHHRWLLLNLRRICLLNGFVFISPA